MSEPFTLKVFVPSGNPEATRIVEKMNWTGKGYNVPRDDWANVKYRPKMSGAGVYILLGYEQDDLGNDMPIAYIGQTDNLRDRLDNHDKNKDFWENVMFFLSTNGGLNRAHITWLEWALMQQAERAKRGTLQNAVDHKEPTLSESEKADVQSFLNEMLRLMPVMGVHFFEEAKVISAPVSVGGLAAPPNAIGALPASRAVNNAGADVVVVPAQPEGFQSAFIEAGAWWAIRIGAKYRDNLKWIAAYRVKPIMAITHMAEIDHIEPFGDDGKYKIVFKGPAWELPHPIPYGNAPMGAMQGPRYCSKATLDGAKSVADVAR